MTDKVEIALTDGTWLEGLRDTDSKDGIILTDVHRSRSGEAAAIPIGKSAFVPWSAILFIILEK